jgi:cytochrome c556
MVVALLGLATPTMGIAQEEPFAAEREARQGQFKLMGFNIGPLATMAQGRVPYDPAVAKTAADNIATITSLDQSRMWPAGSDNESIEGTRALPSIWADPEDFAAKLDGLRTAASALQQVAGTDLNALRGAVRELGAACSACHENYREPE